MRLSRLKFEYNSLKKLEEILLKHNIKSDIFNSKKIKMVPLNKNENFKNNYLKNENNVFKLYYNNITITILKKSNLYSIFEITLIVSLTKSDLILYFNKLFQENEEINNMVKKIIEIDTYFFNKEDGINSIDYFSFNYNDFKLNTILINKFTGNSNNILRMSYIYETKIDIKERKFDSWIFEKNSLKYNIKNDFDFLKSFNLSILEVIDY